MRRPLSLILVLLLLLRGLLGNAMAMGAAPVGPDAHAHIAAASDCAGHASSQAHHAAHGDEGRPATASHCHDAGSSSPAEHQGSCAACGICHSALAAPVGPAPLPHAPPTRVRADRDLRFTNAPAARAFKPPIA